MTENECQDLLQFFRSEHLPEELAQISRVFEGVAEFLTDRLPYNYQLRDSLQRLLEAKDCAVRARLERIE